MLRIPVEPLAGWHLFRIPALDKARIRPTGCADENFSGFDFARRSCGHTSTKSHAAANANRIALLTSLPSNKCFFDLHNVDIEIILEMRGGAAW